MGEATGNLDNSASEGWLTDDTDVSRLIVKEFVLCLGDEDIEACCAGARSFGTQGGKFRYASLCSGSGLGDVGLHTLFSSFGRVSRTRTPEGQCSFLCEIDKQKAQHLARLVENMTPEDGHDKTKSLPLIFKDITQLSGEQGATWSGTSHPVPPTDFLFFGFSCKDLSAQSMLQGPMTRHPTCVLFVLSKDRRNKTKKLI